MVRIDLHTHSNTSDGTQSPAELVADAADSGIDVMALTDHDTTEGWDEAIATAVQRGIGLIPGIEFSARDRGFSVHVLGYLIDPANAELRAVTARIRDSRIVRAERMVEAIGADYALTWDDVREFVGEGATVGRPHIADALVHKGFAADRGEAFRTILSPRGPYYTAHYAPSPQEVVRLIADAGGVPVIAHPAAVSRFGRLGDKQIAELAENGLAGLEVEHRDNDRAGRERLRRLASEFGLLTTGSSDYHGAGKPNRLGEHTTSPEVLAAIIARGTGTPPVL